jgi:NAD+ kinase
MRVLVITKTPLIERLAPADLARLTASGARDGQRLRSGAENHRATMAAVRAALADCDLRLRRVEDLHPDDAAGADLVVTVGGDGTVFTANTLRTEAPFLTVNSDPEGSVGHFTRVTAAGVVALVDRFRAGRAAIQAMPRMELRIGIASWRFLNDCLFTSVNPAEMCRYRLEADGRDEHQRSSGVWIATAAGSTGAIHSAGADPIAPADVPALLYRVREPFQAKGRFALLADCQRPPRGLVLTAAIPGTALYLDGPNLTVPLPPGASASFSPAEAPLRLVLPG